MTRTAAPQRERDREADRASRSRRGDEGGIREGESPAGTPLFLQRGTRGTPPPGGSDGTDVGGILDDAPTARSLAAGSSPMSLPGGPGAGAAGPGSYPRPGPEGPVEPIGPTTRPGPTGPPALDDALAPAVDPVTLAAQLAGSGGPASADGDGNRSGRIEAAGPAPGTGAAAVSGLGPRGVGGPEQALRPVGRVEASVSVARAPLPATPVGLAFPPPFSEAPAALIAPFPMDPEQARAIDEGGYDARQAVDDVKGLVRAFRRHAEDRKEAIGRAASDVKRRVAADGFDRIARVRREVSRARSIIAAETDRTRASLKGEIGRKKAEAFEAINSGALRVMTGTAAQLVKIEAAAKLHKLKAASAVATRQKNARTFGFEEGRRARSAVQQQAADAYRQGQTKASGYPQTTRGRVQAEAVLRVAGEISGELGKPGPDLYDSMVDAGEGMADAIEGAHEKVVESIDAKTTEVNRQLLEGAATSAIRIQALRLEVFRGFDAVESEVNRKIDEVSEAASSDLTAVESQVVGHMSAAIGATLTLVDSETRAATSYVDQMVQQATTAVEGSDRPYVQGVRAGLRNARGIIDDASDQLGEGLEAIGDATAGEFSIGANEVASGLSTIAAQVARGLARVGGMTGSALDLLAGAVRKGVAKYVDAWEGSLAAAQREVDAKYGAAVSGLGVEIDKQLNDGKRKITLEASKAIAKNKELLDQLEPKMEAAAKEAREKYDAPWYEKVGRWLLNALVAILKAVGMLILIIGLALLAVVAIIVGVVLGIKALVVIGVAALLALAFWVGWQIGTGINHRLSTAEGFWQSAWAVVVGVLDVVGLPGVVEGIIHRDLVTWKELTVDEAGTRFGSGLVQVLTVVIPAKIKAARARAAKARAETPVEVPKPEPRAELPKPEPKPEALKSEPVKPEPTRPEPAKPEPAKPEPAKPEPAKPEPEPAKPEPPQPETRPEPTKPEPAEPGPPKPEPAKPEPPKPEAAKPEPPKPAPKPEPPKPEPKPEPPKPEAKPEPPKPEPPKADGGVSSKVKEWIDQVGKDLEEARAEIDSLQREISEADARIRHLQEKARGSTGAARAKALEQLREAREAKAELNGDIQAWYRTKAELLRKQERLLDALKKETYARPSGWPVGLRELVWELAKDEHGIVRDPLTKEPIAKGDPWIMGHKPGWEFWKHQRSAMERGISKEQFRKEYYDPKQYRPETKATSESHAGELKTDQYHGPPR